ncbi:hypothetical protein [Streptomyces sp. NPDC001410]|uniref:hypothetical protein n=1 Tax=Streptomyces sp. NPDC001410 TaxID=3364574 RepID=UPI00369FBF9C
MTTFRRVPTERHERLMAMREKRRLITDADVEAAIEEVDTSGLVPLLEEFVHLPRGRHRTLHIRSLLIGLHLCTQDTGGKIVLERVTDILYFRITPRLRTLLEIPEHEDHDQGFEAAYAVVRRLFHAMKDAMNPSPLPPNGHLSRGEAQDLAAAADADELAERERRLALFTEFLLDASVRPLHGLLSELAEVSLGVDATPVRTFSRGRRTNGPELATDPDAGWYVREGDHRDPDTPVADSMRPAPAPAKKGRSKTPLREKKPSLKKKYLFGYDAHLIVTRDAEHDAVLLDDGTPNPDVLPALVLGAALDKPGHRPAYNGLKILNRLRERGYKPGFLAGDRAYNNSEPDEWQIPVRAMGYKPVYDYRADQLGKQGGTHGAVLVEGRWYCPSMPQPLITATIDLHADRIDRETWVRLIAARRGRQGPVLHQAPHHGPRNPSPLGRPGAKPGRPAQGLPPAHHHHQPRDRSQALAGPGIRRPRMAEGLLPAPQQRRGLQRLRQEPPRRGHRIRRLPPHPRHRSANDPARLPTGPRQPPQDQKVAGHSVPRRRATTPAHPPSPSDERTEDLDPDRAPHTRRRLAGQAPR